MEQLKCPNCGGNIDRSRMICPYCGTQFKNEYNDIIRIETYNPRVVPLKATAMLDESFIKTIGKENASEILVREMARNIADSLIPFMEVYTSYVPERCEYRTDARIRVLKPECRF